MFINEKNSLLSFVRVYRIECLLFLKNYVVNFYLSAFGYCMVHRYLVALANSSDYCKHNRINRFVLYAYVLSYDFDHFSNFVYIVFYSMEINFQHKIYE